MKSKINILFISCCFFLVLFSGSRKAYAEEKQDQEFWVLHPQYKMYNPGVIAVLPMDNFSLEPGLEDALYQNVYNRLQAKGYRRVSVEKVKKAMEQLGVQTPGQLQGISLKRLCALLNTDSVLLGQIDQSAHISRNGYDAVVVSCSLRLIHCQTGIELWKSEQWRTAHRQWAIDPINIFLNTMAHSSASRTDRIAWLVQEMLKTLPAGKVKVEMGNLLDQAVEVNAGEE